MATTRKASTSKAAAARAEKNGHNKTYDWRGLTFELPAKLPGTLMFDMAEFEDEDSGNLAAIFRVLSSLLGGDDQLRRVRAKVEEDNIGFDEVDGVLMELMQGVFAKYGGTLGESQASPQS